MNLVEMTSSHECTSAEGIKDQCLRIDVYWFIQQPLVMTEVISISLFHHVLNAITIKGSTHIQMPALLVI